MSPVDWQILTRLRQRFLEGSVPPADYWRSPADLAAYDQTFAQRIGWKWDFVLGELARLPWRPPAGVLLDWGCGSGIASRAFLDHFGVDGVTSLHCVDRSPLAVRFARERATAKYPGLPLGAGDVEAPDVLLLSHVLNELTPETVESLLETVRSARTVLWVEPGTYESSLALIALRERLRASFHCIAPCPHQERCGILDPQNRPHWCHHFATPPPAVFTDPQWGRFAHLMNIDLRSVPVSFLVLDRRPPSPLPAGVRRVIGRPRLEKGYARLLACDAGGVLEYRLSKRAFPEIYRDWRKGRFASIESWTCSGPEITGLHPVEPSLPLPSGQSVSS